jgi:hypothetical protein
MFLPKEGRGEMNRLRNIFAVLLPGSLVLAISPDRRLFRLQNGIQTEFLMIPIRACNPSALKSGDMGGALSNFHFPAVVLY